MKLFIIFFLLFFAPYGYSESVDSKEVPYENLSSKQALTLLRDQVKRYVDSLMLVLLATDTPRKNQLEILDEIKNIADINGQITIALNQISQTDTGQNKLNIKTIDRDEKISVWVKSQAELIRRRQLELNNLEKSEKGLDKEFWVNLALDGLVIGVGSILMIIPGVGPAFSIYLIAGRTISITGRGLGTFLIGLGISESGVETWNYFSEDEDEKIFSFVSDIAFRDVLTRELFTMLSSVNPEDIYSAINLLQSASLGEESLTKDLLNIIKDENRSIEIRQPALRALKAVSLDNNEKLKKEVIAVLKEVVDKSQIPVLRQTAVVILGEIGAGVSKDVTKYLEQVGIKTEESDELRLMALIEVGRDKDYFSVFIEELVDWLEGRNYEKYPLNIKPDFSNSLLESLLLVNQKELSKNHIIVLKEFIRSDILNVELKIRFSETFLKWDNSLENTAFLRDYLNPAKDIKLYVENELFKEENLFEENYGAYVFLTNQISSLEKTDDLGVILQKIELIIKRLKREYPNQPEIVEKLEKIVNFYKKILESA